MEHIENPSAADNEQDILHFPDPDLLRMSDEDIVEEMKEIAVVQLASASAGIGGLLLQVPIIGPLMKKRRYNKLKAELERRKAQRGQKNRGDAAK
jgi:hypothetical protein